VKLLLHSAAVILLSECYAKNVEFEKVIRNSALAQHLNIVAQKESFILK
jgi:hypothetical protein